jgi:hypothetical protein
MAAERLSMRTIKEVLRLKWEKKLSNKQIATSCNIARSTIRDYLERAQRACLSWPGLLHPIWRRSAGSPIVCVRAQRISREAGTACDGERWSGKTGQ